MAEGGEKGGIPTWLQIALAVGGFLITAGSAFFALSEKNRADLLAQQLANEKEFPRIEQGRFVFAGDVLKALLGAKKGIAIEGLPNPEFVATALGRQIFDEIKKTKDARPLQGISVEFLSFTNKGPRQIDTLKVMLASEAPIDLGSVSVNTTKLLPVIFEAKQPYKILPDPAKPHPASYNYSYTLLGGKHERTGSIPPRATLSWIPVVGNSQGVARALSDEDMERHLAEPQ